MTYIDKMDIEETERIREQEAVAQEMMYDEKRNKYQELLDLVKANPTLPVIPRVDSEVVVEEGYNYWFGHFGKAYIEEMVCFGDRWYTRDEQDEIEERLADLFMDEESIDDYGDGVERVAHERAEALPWRKVITVYIGVPEVEINELKAEAREILEEYASSYSEVDVENFARKLEKIARRAKLYD